jgi:CheY-like chemotaxis protein
MSGDLVSLRMILIGAAQPEQQLWRQAAAMASVLIDFEIHDRVAAATPALAKGGTDVCLLDGGLSDAHKTKAIGAARATQPAPLVFVCAPKGVKRLEGVDGMLTKPSNVDEAGRLVEICVRARIPTRVLVVDDSGTMRSIVRKILAASHFALDVHEASEAKAAIDQLRSGNFGIAFLDYNMPGVTGFETLSEIKRECPNVAVVMMSSTLEGGMAERAQASGAHAFLKKPFYPADIDAVLERYFGLGDMRV